MIPWALYYPPQAATQFLPSLYVDITSTYDLKIEALKAHQSQHDYIRDHHRTDIWAQVEAEARY